MLLMRVFTYNKIGEPAATAETLMNFGLTKNEARAYLALLRTGECRVGRLILEPLITKMVIDFSQMLSRYGWFILFALVIAVIGAVLYIRSPEGRNEWDRFCVHGWLFGDLVRKFETARFSRTLAALLKGGVPMLEALGTVQGVVGNRLLAPPPRPMM